MDRRYQRTRRVIKRLGADKRLRAPFTEGSAVAAVAAATRFPACDAMATRLHRDISKLEPILAALLRSAVRLV